MLQRVQRTLRRRERLLHVRGLLQHQAEQALAAVLNQEEGLKQERTSFENAEERSRAVMLNHLGPGETIRSMTITAYADRLRALCELAEQKGREIQSLQPRIQQSRQLVVMRHKGKRAMEILTDKAREVVAAEHLRLEQRDMDDLTAQRHDATRRRPHGRLT